MSLTPGGSSKVSTEHKFLGIKPLSRHKIQWFYLCWESMEFFFFLRMEPVFKTIERFFVVVAFPFFLLPLLFSSLFPFPLSLLAFFFLSCQYILFYDVLGALFITTALFYDASQELWVQALGKITFYVYSSHSHAIYFLDSILIDKKKNLDRSWCIRH